MADVLAPTGDYESRLVALADIHPSPWNPRTITEDDFEALCRSLETWPDFLLERTVIVQAETGDIVGGNMRYRGLRRMASEPGKRYPTNYRLEDGRPGVPARIRRLPDATAKAFALLDNNVSGQYQPEETGEILHDLQRVGIDPQTLSFRPVDLEVLLEASGGGSGREPVEFDADALDAPAEGVEARCRAGDLWRLGAHRVLCADATGQAALRRVVDTTDVQWAFLDPPYNVGLDYGQGGAFDRLADPEYADLCRALLGSALERTERLVVTPGVANLALWYALEPQPRWTAAWTKMNGVSRNGWGGPQKWEPLLVYGRPLIRDDDVWDASNAYGGQLEDGAGHPAPKPVKLLAGLIESFTEAGDTVLDPTLGSGTTLVAAEATGRTCLGVEISPAYVDVVLARWERMTGGQAERVADAVLAGEG